MEVDKISFIRTIPIEEFLASRGSKFARRLNGTQSLYYCAHHGDNSTPNLIVNSGKNICNCFRCGFSGDVISCQSYITHSKSSRELDKASFVEIVNSLYKEFYGQDLTPFKSKSNYELEKEYKVRREVYEKCMMDYNSGRLRGFNKNDINYLSHRGLSLTTAQLCGLAGGTFSSIPHIIIPLIWDNQIRALKYRRNDLVSEENSRYYIPTTSETGFPYIPDFSLFKKSKTVFFCEDSFSALSIRELGFASISLYSGNKIMETSIDLFRSILQDKHIIIIPDNDEPGFSLAAQIEDNSLGKSSYIQVCGDGYKDFSDFLASSKKDAYFMINELWRLCG